jgi:putative sulfotransferase
LDRFIVGTGRCGSTLLSRMIAECPSVLSVFEFFNGLDAARRFADAVMPASEFFEMIAAEQPFLTAVMRRGYPVAEVIYPFGSEARYGRSDPLPWILVGILPRLSDDPDALFDEVKAFTSAQPDQPPLAHYRALFDWLTARLGHRCWIERSGSSIDYLASLNALFPEARFLHIHRDGPEAALSMREHHAYRLPISFIYDVPTDSGLRVSQLGALDLDAAPKAGDAIGQILESRPPAESFGRYWSDQLERGFAAVPAIGSERYREIRFEDLVSDPIQSLRQIAEFFDLDPDEDNWSARGAALVRGPPPTRAEHLPRAERAALEAACAPGRKLLGRRT